jgi:hypothetical protein
MFSSPQSEGEAMPAERLPMRKVREVLRLKYACGASERLIAVLATHAKVFDVAVIGVPNEEFGEEVKAVVQPAGGRTPGRNWRPSSSPSVGSISATSKVRARSISIVSCRAIRTASSTSDWCGIATGQVARAG